MPTNKSFPIPIGFPFYRVDMIAFMAHLTGVSRLNKQNLDAMFYSFVDKKLSQLEESPAIAKPAFLLASRLLVGLIPNPSQILQSNNLVFGLSAGYNAMTNSVIYPRLKALFLARQPFQQFSTSTSRTASAFRGFLLDACSQLGIMISNFGNFFTAKFAVLGL